MLDLVAAHADVWDVNLPPVPALVGRAGADLEAACHRRGRDPAEISRSMWIFTRVDEAAGAALGEFRRLNPWFRSIPDAEVAKALVVGGPGRCREQLRALVGELHIDGPVIDLSGLGAEASRRALEALAPGK